MEGTQTAQHKPVIVVHGGAGLLSAAYKDAAHEGVRAAARVGYEVLARGGSAIDAVEAAVHSLEECPVLNAGYGSCLTADGTVECDAALMDGSTLRSGAVAAVPCVRNAISLARAVMDKTRHSLLAADGALKFAHSIGFPVVDAQSLITDKARDALRSQQEASAQARDTVGAVALDVNGNLAAGTSTGGMTGKLPGRVGDSPIIGCGNYADNESVAVSATGHGERIISVAFAARVAHQVQYQAATAQAACEHALKVLRERVDGEAGVIAIDRSGNVGIAHNSENMSWAAIVNGEIESGIDNKRVSDV